MTQSLLNARNKSSGARIQKLLLLVGLTHLINGKQKCGDPRQCFSMGCSKNFLVGKLLGMLLTVQGSAEPKILETRILSQ